MTVCSARPTESTSTRIDVDATVDGMGRPVKETNVFGGVALVSTDAIDSWAKRRRFRTAST
jgi:hypothetical protein